jgi:Protein of unknown function (DUF1501)
MTMSPLTPAQLHRRAFLGNAAQGLGALALASLWRPAQLAAAPARGVLGSPPWPQKARRVIWLAMAGGPSHLETFDPKPKLAEMDGKPMPESLTRGQQLAQLQGQQLKCLGPQHPFAAFGKNQTEICSLFPNLGSVIDDICLIRSMTTDAINHDPAHMFMNTGSQIAGRPSMGAWVTYGLGSENQNLPAFVVLISQANALNPDQPLFSRLWGNGFLSSKYQGVRFRAGAEPVLYLDDPPGISRESRRRMLDSLAQLNKMWFDAYGDPEIETRITQYEMAYRMQTSVPDLMDLSKEPDSVFEMYGPDSRKPGTYAANCLLARRLAERNVRFIQLYHRGWDQHNDLPRDIALQAKGTDQPSAALVQDLKQRGLLDDTLVVWGGEFGRTVYCQGKLSETNYGRDHHPKCFAMWMAGGGIKPGISIGQTDDYCYNVVEDSVPIHDLQATILNCLGVEHTKLTFRFQGRDFRLTDVEGKVVSKVLA